jgi:hypothetical protein
MYHSDACQIVSRNVCQPGICQFWLLNSVRQWKRAVGGEPASCQLMLLSCPCASCVIGVHGHGVSDLWGRAILSLV